MAILQHLDADHLQTAITRLTRTDHMPAGKTFDHRGKTLSPHAGRYQAETIILSGETPAALLASFDALLDGLERHQAIILGHAPELPDHYEIRPQRQLSGDGRGVSFVRGVPTIARLKEHFNPSRLILLDYDPDPAMPAPWLDADEAARWELLTAALTELTGAARLVTPSSSGRVLGPDGSPLNARAGCHTYILSARDLSTAELDRARVALDARLWAGGLGFIKRSSSGSILRRALVDASVWTTGREVFEAPPAVSAPYRLIPRMSHVHPGSAVAIVTETTGAQRDHYRQATGATITEAEGAIQIIDTASLRLDTSVMTEHGRLTIKQFLAGDWDKVRCQTPFRHSTSWAGVLRRTKTGCVLYDAGTTTTYRLGLDPIELTGRLEHDLTTLAGCLPPAAQGLARAIVWRHAWRCPTTLSYPELGERIFAARPELDRQDIGALLGYVARRAATAALRPILLDPAELPRGVQYRRVESIEEARRLILTIGYGVHLVKAPHGSGKTQGIMRPIALSDEAVCAIAPRRSLVADLASRLNLAHYRASHDDPNLAICINSIIQPIYSRLDDARTVLIDEVGRIIRDCHDPGSTHGTAGATVWHRLMGMIRASRLTIGADADLSTHDVAMLAREIPDVHVWLIPEAAVPLTGIFASDDQAMAALHTAVAAGEPTLFVADSAKRVAGLAEELRARYPDKRILAIHDLKGLSSNATPAALALLRDINARAADWDVVLCSPTVESGVSLTREHFTRHIALYGGTIEPSAFNQMLRRDRTARRWLIGIAGSGMRGLADSYESALNSLTAAQRIIRPDAPAIPATPFDADACGVLVQSRAARNAYAQGLWYLLKARGWTCERADKAPAPTGRDLRADARDALERAVSAAIQAAPELLPSERDRLEVSAHVTPAESAALARAEVRDATATPHGPVTDELIQVWNHGELTRQNRHFEAIQTSEAVSLRDNAEAEAGIPVSLRHWDGARARAWQALLAALGIDRETGQGDITEASARAAWERLEGTAEGALLERFGILRIGAKCPRYLVRWIGDALRKAGLYIVASGRQGAGGAGGRVYQIGAAPLRASSGQIRLPGWAMMAEIRDRRVSARCAHRSLDASSGTAPPESARCARKTLEASSGTERLAA